MVCQENLEIKITEITMEEKIHLMENMGIQNLVHPFDTVFSQLTAEEFVRTVLVNQFDIHKIIIGHDHRFRDRNGKH
jgi:riboflavin kinase/FMN adenylyltransferase